ncbi:hypothetical protein ACKUB1_14010 [Methanospirillum stamsii]|uniref:Uncharacterized protein n=1 Tax=Methanospirillum stamsii TaxID=1277351 RepID=A0A2V2N7Z0_9EURY|nr:hypothetical protein [Methanospirillum stamsii]PWR74780.1 hypothetical protein DLD82_07750 [Methanospirillum stamsii]
MVQLGERFLYAFEITGACIIGLIFVVMAVSAESADMAWKLVIAAVLCFCIGLVFGVMYISNNREKEKNRFKM